MRDALRAAFRTTLDELHFDRALLGIADDLRQRFRRPQLVIAFGKGARTMAQAVLALRPTGELRGLVVPGVSDAAPMPPFEVITAGHPLPDEGSLRAGLCALELLRSARPDEDVLFLVSGGGSAMLEQPAAQGVGLAELRTLHQALIGSGADIAAINTVRRHLSAVKGGRLAMAGRGCRRQLTLAISDVPMRPDGGHDWTSLASGATSSDPTTVADCRRVLDRLRLWHAVPEPLRTRLERGELPPPMSLDDELLRRSEFHVLLDERHAAAALLRQLRDHGVETTERVDVDDRPFERAADELLARLDGLGRTHPGRPVAIVATGELSVPLPALPGVGGRNLQFALHCAERIQGRPVTVLSCGTDGVDGNSPAAGAVVDGRTIARAQALGFDAALHLARCDAFPLLDAVGDTVVTGPTGTNVRDLRVLVHHAST